MRRAVLAIALALSASPALAAEPAPPPGVAIPPSPPPLPPRPDPFVAPQVAYIRVGQADAGRWQYVNIPVGRAPE